MPTKAAEDTMPSATKMAADMATTAATTMPTPTKKSTMQMPTSAKAKSIGEKSSLGSICGESVAPRATVAKRKSSRMADFTGDARKRLNKKQAKGGFV